ncbi:hypothetical protein SBADM41S_07374 [Streptomyces badius]
MPPSECRAPSLMENFPGPACFHPSSVLPLKIGR